MAGESVRPYFVIFFAVLLGLGFAAMPIQRGCAAVMDNTACDENYWETLTRRAWMEGKHDQEAAQVIITKPVSVLALTCFPAVMQDVDYAADDMFSDNYLDGSLFKNEDWIPLGHPMREPQYQPTIRNYTYLDAHGFHWTPDSGYERLGPNNMGDALQDVILDGYEYYMNDNFASPDNTGATAHCYIMGNVWTQAKCTNFNKDTFWRFEWLAANEPRKAIWGCVSTAGGSGPSRDRMAWNRALYGVDGRTTNSDPPNVSAYPPPLPYDPRPNMTNRPLNLQGGMDAVKTYGSILTTLAPLNPNGCNSLRPIPTGITIITPETDQAVSEEYDDAICSAPGCWYDWVADICEGPAATTPASPGGGGPGGSGGP